MARATGTATMVDPRIAAAHNEEREEVYPIKIPVIRHEVVDMVPTCRRGMKCIRKQ